MRAGYSPPRRFGCCDRASDVGVPRAWRGELLGWSCVGVFSGFCYVVIACRERCCGGCRAEICCCCDWRVVRRDAMFVPLCVCKVSVCGTYVEIFSSDEAGTKHVLWCCVWVESCSGFAGLFASVSRCVVLEGVWVFFA